ncbi:MAG TPA: MlaD family protein [Bryobacterales bacterium]|nr:MlaD family protein [Bryobacterales bacterium]
MPQTKRLAWAQLRVGVMAIAAIAIFVVLVFLISGRTGLLTRMAEIRTYVDDSASLKIGAPVRLNGIDAGNVRAVRLSGQGGSRTVEVVLGVRQDLLSRIPVDSQAAVNPEGVFGDKYVNITRGQSPQPVAPGGEIRSLDTKEFQEIVNQSYNVLASLQAITGRINSLMSQVESGKGTIGKLLYDDTLYKRMDAVVAQTQDVVGLVQSGKGTLGKLLADDALYNEANATLQRVDTVLSGVQAGRGTIGMLLNDPALYQNTNHVLEQAGKIVEGVNAGQGNAGKFLKDEALYRKVNATLDNVNTTIERANSGQGTVGQLLVNRALYDSLTGMTSETQGLLQDIHKNPKKFLRIKLAIF